MGADLLRLVVPKRKLQGVEKLSETCADRRAALDLLLRFRDDVDSESLS